MSDHRPTNCLYCLSQWSFRMVVFVSTVKEPTLSSMSDFPQTPDTKSQPRQLWTWVCMTFFLSCTGVFSLHCIVELTYVAFCLGSVKGNTVCVLYFRNLPMLPCGRCACATKTSAQRSMQPGPGNTKMPRWSWPTETLPSTGCMSRSRATWWCVEGKKKTLFMLYMTWVFIRILSGRTKMKCGINCL